MAIGVFVLAGCSGDEPASEPETDAAAAEVTDDADESTDAADADADEDRPGAEDEQADADEPDDESPPPTAVSEPVGVVYEAVGSLNESFGLIQTPEVSVFSNDEVTAYVDAETVTVCPTGEGCVRTRREGIEAMGMLGGQLVTDMTAFASSVPFSSSSNETIAGRDARCIVPDDVEELQEYCYDLVSGIALRWEVIDEQVPTSITAIEVFEPTAEDLSPAGPVEDLTDVQLPEGMDLGDLDLGDLDLENLDIGGQPGA